MEDNIFQSQPGPFVPIGLDESSTLKRTHSIPVSTKCTIPKNFDQTIDKYYYLNSLEGFADPSSPSIVVSDANITSDPTTPTNIPPPITTTPTTKPPSTAPTAPTTPTTKIPTTPTTPTAPTTKIPTTPTTKTPTPQKKPIKKKPKQVHIKGSSGSGKNYNNDDDYEDDDYYQYYDIDNNYFYPTYLPAWDNPFFVGPPPPPLPVSPLPPTNIVVPPNTHTTHTTHTPTPDNNDNVDTNLFSLDIIALIVMFMLLFLGMVLVFKK